MNRLKPQFKIPSIIRILILESDELQQVNELSPKIDAFYGSSVSLPAIIQTVGTHLNEPLMQSHTCYGRNNTLLAFTRLKKILFILFFMRKVAEHFFRVAFAELASPHS